MPYVRLRCGRGHLFRSFIAAPVTASKRQRVTCPECQNEATRRHANGAPYVPPPSMSADVFNVETSPPGASAHDPFSLTSDSPPPDSFSSGGGGDFGGGGSSGDW